MLIVKALYGLKSSGASWRSILSDILSKDGLWYKSSEEDKEVWIKMEVFPNWKTYYLMILVYVNNILVFLEDNSIAIDSLGKFTFLNKEECSLPTGTLALTPRIFKL